MKYLEAHKTLLNFTGGTPLSFLLGMSGTSDQLLIFLRAFAATKGFALNVDTFPYGTLIQTISSPQEKTSKEVFVLMPWDFIPELDWRSGFPKKSLHMNALMDKASSVTEKLKKRKIEKILYLPAPTPSLFYDGQKNRKVSSLLTLEAESFCADILEPSCFSLSSYLATGMPIGGGKVSEVAQIIVNILLCQDKGTSKILVTDLDNVMWSGVIAEDGLKEIKFQPNGEGFPHFLYQSLLRRLIDEGVLVAAVSRNDPKVANEPFLKKDMLLTKKDLVALIASYDSKSSHIKSLANQLNLDLNSFVFIDDNPIEIAEVSTTLPEVTCIQFPNENDSLPKFFDKIDQLFNRGKLSNEDKVRTDLYRRRLESLPEVDLEPADLTKFLKSLNMTLELKSRTKLNMTRALQLINKTNQFNINGRRFEDNEAEKILSDNGKLFTASLYDASGSHGEVLSCLINKSGLILSLVMSCRVFQRRAEYAFLSNILRKWNGSLKLDFRATQKNTPVKKFLSEPAFSESVDEEILIDTNLFLLSHNDDEKLFSFIGLNNE